MSDELAPAALAYSMRATVAVLRFSTQTASSVAAIAAGNGASSPGRAASST